MRAMRFGWIKGVAAAAALGVAACGGDASDDEAQRAAAFFMQSNARAEGVTTLPSGLQYKVIRSGPEGGVSPDANDLVRVNYEGALADGTVFDSSFERGAPYVTTPQDVIEGWKEGLQLMGGGVAWIVEVPPELGDGERGGPPVIPARAVLVFRVQLLDVAEAPGGGVTARG